MSSTKVAMAFTDVGKTYDDKPVFSDINLSFYYGAKIGVVGGNGAGKSTLLRIMAGEDTNHQGEVRPAKGLRIKHVPQEPRLDPDLDVRGNLETAVKPVKDLLKRFEEITARMGEDMSADEMDKLMTDMTETQEAIDLVDGWEIDRFLDIAADAMVLPPDNSAVSTLSGGERRRVALCMALIEKPDLLLLDEPTNHLDAETIAWLEHQLRDYPGTVIVVTHDRYFLDNITEWILELEHGRGTPYKGNYSAWLRQKAERLRIKEKQESEQQRMLQREFEWISASPKGRLKQNKARVQRYNEMASKRFEVKGGDILIQIPPGPKLGERVLEFKNVSKAYEDLELVKDVSFELPPGGIVGVVGPNGVGKTTMFRMIVGEEKPDSGEIELGASVQLAYVDQNRDSLTDTNSIYEEISGGNEDIELGHRRMNARAYVARFNFRGPQQQKKVGDLSGGERNRVHLAKLLKSGGNVLLLDEPTNDLDVDTLRVLEEALLNFAGCAVVISHDRFFLDRICTHLLVFEGDGNVRWFIGNFSQYEEKYLTGHEAERAERRSKYKRLTIRT